MISVKVEELESVFDYVNNESLTYDNYTFGCGVLEKFTSCITIDNPNDYKYIEHYKTAIREVFNKSLDIRNVEFDYLVSKVYEHITNCPNVLLTPIELVLHKFVNRQNYFLTFKQKFKQQIINNNISIDSIDISDCLFILSNLSLISNELVEMYVSLESVDTLLSARNLMDNCGNVPESNMDIMEDSRTNNEVNSITFSDNFETLVQFNNFIEGRDTATSFHNLINIAKEDYARFVSDNGVHAYFIKGLVHPLLNRYNVITSEIITTQTKVIDNLTILINITKNVHKKYYHKLTKCILSWLILLLKSELEEANSDGSQERPVNKLRYSKLVKTFSAEQINLKSTDVLTMVKVCEELQDAICKKFNCVIHNITADTGQVYTESINFDNDENYLSNLNNRIEQSSFHKIKALNESFEVLKNGEIKIVLKSKTSYMEEYAINHRLLKNNCEQNDIDGMKYNLVYAMLIVESTEKNVLYNKKIDKNSDLYKDAEKARSFALNDIKTYSEKVRKNDRYFDLNTFYRKVKADQSTITIDAPSTISGLRKIISAITV